MQRAIPQSRRCCRWSARGRRPDCNARGIVRLKTNDFSIVFDRRQYIAFREQKICADASAESIRASSGFSREIDISRSIRVEVSVRGKRGSKVIIGQLEGNAVAVTTKSPRRGAGRIKGGVAVAHRSASRSCHRQFGSNSILPGQSEQCLFRRCFSQKITKETKKTTVQKLTSFSSVLFAPGRIIRVMPALRTGS